MPLKEDQCSGKCTCRVIRCPDCNSAYVTPRENMDTLAPNDVVDYHEAGEYEYEHVCWECGWSETVTMIIERD